MSLYILFIIKILYINNGPYFIIRRYLDHILQSPALAGFIAFRYLVHFQPKTSSLFGKEH